MSISKQWNELVEFLRNHEWPEVNAWVDIEGAESEDIDEIIPELENESDNNF